MDPRYIVIGLCIVALGAAFVYLFLRKRKLPEGPVPKSWRKILNKRVRFFRDLDAPLQEKFLKRVQGFFEVVTIVGAETEVTLTDKLLVAASAEIPLFGFNQWRYPNLDTVILHPKTFSKDFNMDGAGADVLGIVGNRELSRTMVLSKPALHQGFGRHTDHNVGIHEFTHLLDMSDGSTDGSPDYYLSDGLVGPWMRLVHKEMAKIRDGESDIDTYAATNEAEFFAVTSEYFFMRPDDMAQDHPELYGMLENIFKQNLSDEVSA